MITLYSTNCPKCKVLEQKLKQSGIDYSVVDDVDKVVEFGRNNGIKSAPILDVDGEIYDFNSAIKYIKTI